MQEHAGRANQMLREFRKKYDENEERWEKRVDDKARRQEIRFWKRMAMPDVADTEEGYWSDDDDIVDPAEKERLKEVERKVAEALARASSAGSQGEDSEGDGSEPHCISSSIIGGVPMERDRDGSSMVGIIPVPPPRPSSTGSTGSTGAQAE